MDLSNATPLTTLLHAGAPEELNQDRRLAVLVAKATFSVGSDGQVELETQWPLACFDQDQELGLGLVPQDDLVRAETDLFEVILLGAAYAGDRPASRVPVRMRLGDVTRELIVHGERSWTPQGPGQAAPFERMPMTWDRAFGGTASVEIDKGAFVEVADPRNREGVGFDPAPQAEALKNNLGCPEGYPRVPDALALPNMERPNEPITKRSDTPMPACWATLSWQSGVHAERIMAEQQRLGLEPEEVDRNLVIFHRAHPDWVIPMPRAGARFELRNATPDGLLWFDLPRLRVLFDYLEGDQVTRAELVPQRLVVFAEERCFTISYGRTFSFRFVGEQERSLRLRAEKGWYG